MRAECFIFKAIMGKTEWGHIMPAAHTHITVIETFDKIFGNITRIILTFVSHRRM